MTPEKPWSPSRAFAHPLWLAALMLLVLNDAWLKHADVAPRWLTGNLSNFAGLLVAPATLAWTLSVRGKRAWLACHAGIGVLFVLSSIPAIREALSAASVARLSPDPSELSALPMLLVSAWIFGRSARPPARGELTA